MASGTSVESGSPKPVSPQPVSPQPVSPVCTLQPTIKNVGRTVGSYGELIGDHDEENSSSSVETGTDEEVSPECKAVPSMENIGKTMSSKMGVFESAELSSPEYKFSYSKDKAKLHQSSDLFKPKKMEGPQVDTNVQQQLEEMKRELDDLKRELKDLKNKVEGGEVVTTCTEEIKKYL